ncbi:leucyl aminopeptidase [Sulfolobales archaeon HS-7]|nr:leucyl aminopeptidase [Sulfolobales archaeon HS-7]
MQVSKYDLFLDVNFEKAIYSGRVKVEMKGEKVEFDAVDLAIKNVKVDGKEVKFSYDGKKLVAETQVEKEVEVEFDGSVTSYLMGFYKAPYKGGYMFSTQFEAIGARRMFPCIDRPGIKAVFSLSVRVSKELDVISNMPVKEVREEGNLKTVLFHDTPPMSTYLLYLGIGKFDTISDKLGEREITVATPPGLANKGKFALEVAKRVIQFYENYYGIPYQLPKMHLIAVPEFAAGAMENWGAITFRETALLVDENTAELNRRRVAEVVAHEIAHQWFGDLVTMKWWDDLWLNESFATFMSYKAISTLYPDWTPWKEFMMSETGGAFARDSLTTTHPIHVDVKQEEELEQIFDAISYGKGASVLRMIESYLGEEDFKKGIRLYLNSHKFSNAEARELWESLEKASGKPVSKIMTEWITKAGHPIITVREDGDELHLSQRRFLYKGDTDDVWPIPLTYYSDGEFHATLLEEKEKKIVVKRPYKLNAGGVGFYRVKYPNFEAALASCKTPEDRWNVLVDIMGLLYQGGVSLREYLSVVEKEISEDDWLPAWTLSDQLSSLYAIFPEKVKDVYIKFHRNQLNRLEGKTDENSKMFKGVVAQRLALVDEEYAKEMASSIDEYFTTEPALRRAIVNGYAISGDEPYDKLVSMYKKSIGDEDRNRILAGLMNTKNKVDLALALGYLLSGEVKKQDAFRYFMEAASNPHGRDVAWRWLKANFDTLRAMYHATGILARSLGYAIPYLGLVKEDEVRKFFTSLDMPEATIGIKTGLEMLDIVLKLRGK